MIEDGQPLKRRCRGDARSYGQRIQLNNPLWVDSFLAEVDQNPANAKSSAGVELADKYNTAFTVLFIHELDVVTNGDGMALHLNGVGYNGVGRNNAGPSTSSTVTPVSASTRSAAAAALAVTG